MATKGTQRESESGKDSVKVNSATKIQALARGSLTRRSLGDALPGQEKNEKAPPGSAFVYAFGTPKDPLMSCEEPMMRLVGFKELYSTLGAGFADQSCDHFYAFCRDYKTLAHLLSDLSYQQHPELATILHHKCLRLEARSRWDNQNIDDRTPCAKFARTTIEIIAKEGAPRPDVFSRSQNVATLAGGASPVMLVLASVNPHPEYTVDEEAMASSLQPRTFEDVTCLANAGWVPSARNHSVKLDRGPFLDNAEAFMRRNMDTASHIILAIMGFTLSQAKADSIGAMNHVDPPPHAGSLVLSDGFVTLGDIIVLWGEALRTGRNNNNPVLVIFIVGEHGHHWKDELEKRCPLAKEVAEATAEDGKIPLPEQLDFMVPRLSFASQEGGKMILGNGIVVVPLPDGFTGVMAASPPKARSLNSLRQLSQAAVPKMPRKSLVPRKTIRASPRKSSVAPTGEDLQTLFARELLMDDDDSDVAKDSGPRLACTAVVLREIEVAGFCRKVVTIPAWTLRRLLQVKEDWPSSLVAFAGYELKVLSMAGGTSWHALANYIQHVEDDDASIADVLDCMRVQNAVDSKVVALICRHLSDRDVHLRALIVEVLKVLSARFRGYRASVNILGQYCEHVDPDVRSKALRALVCLGEEGNRKVLSLAVERLDDESRIVRCDAIKVLQWLSQRGDPTIVAALAPRLSDADWRVRHAASDALSILALQGDDTVVVPLISNLEDPDWAVRRIAVETLKVLTIPGDERVFAALASLALRPTSDAGLKTASREALKKVRGPRLHRPDKELFGSEVPMSSARAQWKTF